MLYPKKDKVMMEIEVRLFATLQDLVPKKNHSHFFSMEIERGSTAGAVLHKLKIPEEMAKIILVNGRYSSEDTVLEEGDVLGVFPPLGGG